MLVFYLESYYELQILFKRVLNKFYIYTFEKKKLFIDLSFIISNSIWKLCVNSWWYRLNEYLHEQKTKSKAHLNNANIDN